MIIVIQTLVYFRQSIFGAIQRLLGPLFASLTFSLKKSKNSSEDEGSDEEAFADYDDEKGVVFFPPVYAQRYAAIVDCLKDERWCGKLQKIVDLGYHDMSFIKYLKDIRGVTFIIGVDIDVIPLRFSSNLLADNGQPSRDPLQVMLFQGNAADPDYRLIGCDAVVAIEMIEHMLPHDLERLVHTIFGFIKPWIVVLTTPNGDFNVLFKALQSNGLRRLDHYFEWSQEQFHDWCSNIVLRYPQYTVSCKGIGPGPAGTEHLGCCSQLALFVATDYHKQRDLNLNSLAVVADDVSEAPESEIEWCNSESMVESKTSDDQNLGDVCYDSITELMYSKNPSCLTFILTSPSYFSFQSVTYEDKMSQCNIDTEIGKQFLMYNDEDFCVNVLKPTRKLDNKIYVIEDVLCRLNCSTSHVRKFSKSTLDKIIKNRLDSRDNTREVIDEIKKLTDTLNIDQNTLANESDNLIWHNINWGDNAPYWNQYYKVVQEFRYPMKDESWEQRLLDIVLEEINKVADSQFDFRNTLDGKIVIPLERIMALVETITTDRDKVRDFLEWNGYDIVDDVLIHSRLMPQHEPAVASAEDWDVNDLISDVKSALNAK